MPTWDVRSALEERLLSMPITIYGTDWCDDTRRTRAFLAGKGMRLKFVDIDARPEEVEALSVDGRPISIPVVVFDNGSRLDDPSVEELEETLSNQGVAMAIRHRTKLNQDLQRFEQYRNKQLVASADFIERDGTVVIVGIRQHDPQDPSIKEENVERLTSGLVEIINQAGRTLDIDIGSAEARTPPPAATEPEPEPEPSLEAEEPRVPTADATVGSLAASPPAVDNAPEAPPTPAPAGSTAAALAPDAPTGLCPLTQRFNDLWSQGVEHREAARLASSEGISRLAIIKGLHALWEMPLTPEAMSLAFGEAASNDLAAMFHVLGWIIEQNPSSTMSEFQAFDDATGISTKTHALSIAQRPRDTISVVDRMGPGLHLRTIDENRAREMAAATIKEADGVLRIQDQSTLRMSFGWMFLYQSAEFLDSGDYSTMISGNAPLLIDRFTGALWITDTVERPAVYAENYEATGNPLTPKAALAE